MTTANLKLDELVPAQSQPHIPVNSALNKLDVLVQARVLDRNLTAPPGSPAEGDAYIPASPATGAWAGWEDRIAYYNAGWKYAVPEVGWTVWVIDEAKEYRYGQGSPATWAEIAGGGGGGGSIQISSTGSPGGTVAAATQLVVTGGVVSELAPGVAGLEITGGGGGGSGIVESIVAGTGVTVDDTDPANPIVSASGGGGGGGATFLDLLASSRWFYASVDNANTGMRTIGLDVTYQNSRTSSNGTASASSLAQQAPRVRVTSSSASNANASIHPNSNDFSVICSSSGDPLGGGFEASMLFSYQAMATDQLLFVGYANQSGDLSNNFDVTTMTNIVALTKAEADTNLFMRHNDGSGGSTAVDLGVAAAALIDKLLQLTIRAAPDGDIEWDLWNLEDDDHYTGTITTNKPADDARLVMFLNANTGTVSSTAVSLDVHRMAQAARDGTPVASGGGGGGGSGIVESIVAGTGVTVDDTDPANPIVSASGGGGSSPVVLDPAALMFGTESNWAPSGLDNTVTVLYCRTASGGTTVYSIVPPSPDFADGQEVMLINRGTNNLQLADITNAIGTAGGQFINPGAGAKNISAGDGTRLVMDTARGGWRPVG